MTTIWKFELALSDLQGVPMPRGATILSVGLDPSGTLCLWALVDPENETESFTIMILGTGHSAPVNGMAFIGTVRSGSFMWHIFGPKRPYMKPTPARALKFIDGVPHRAVSCGEIIKQIHLNTGLLTRSITVYVPITAFPWPAEAEMMEAAS